MGTHIFPVSFFVVRCLPSQSLVYASPENGGPWNRRFRTWKPSFLDTISSTWGLCFGYATGERIDTHGTTASPWTARKPRC